MKVVFGLILTLMSFSSLADLTVVDATVRLLPPTVPNTSAYFSITNNGDTDRIIIAAKSPIAPTVELHEHIMRDDMMRMQQVEEVLVAAGESVNFEPGGLHLMIFGLNKALTKDETVSLTLVMKNGELIEFNAVVQPPVTHHHHH